MGVSIHKVAEEKLHKQNKPERRLATATMEAYIDKILCEEVRKYPHLNNCSMKEYKDIYMDFNSWREIAQTLLGQERYCNLAQSACVTRLCTRKYESNEVYFARLCVRLYAYSNVPINKRSILWPLAKSSGLKLKTS